MKILILGTGKSGTTALVYKVAGGIPNCQAFSGGQPGKHLNNYENAVYKHTYEERKGKSFDLYKEHLQREHYDRKIWIARDPRDAAVSRMLYRWHKLYWWHKGYTKKKKQYLAHLDLVLKKEQDPKSIPFHVICRYAGYDGWPINTEEVLDEERTRYQNMTDFVKTLGEDWYLFTYENMVGKNFDGLNEYLGFEVVDNAEVPKSTGKAKVVRKKAVGDWRHWFTEEDVKLFKPTYLAYMKLIGYDCDDWALSPNPLIEPRYASEYMKGLVRRKPLNFWQKLKHRLARSFGKGN
jgi:hypothetical protein